MGYESTEHEGDEPGVLLSCLVGCLAAVVVVARQLPMPQAWKPGSSLGLPVLVFFSRRNEGLDAPRNVVGDKQSKRVANGWRPCCSD